MAKKSNTIKAKSKEEEVVEVKKPERLYSVNVKKRVTISTGALEVKDNPHKVTLKMKNKLIELGLAE